MTVRELERRVDAREMQEWLAFYGLEPFGAERDDWRSAQLTTIVANALRGKGARSFRMADFMWKRPGPPRRMDWKAMREVFAGIAAKFQAREDAGKAKKPGQ